MENKLFRLRLNIIWFKDFLGLAIDNVDPMDFKKHYSLTPYYFWPKTEAWKQLKLELDSKLWLTQNEKIEILQIIGDLMNYWLLYRKTKTIFEIKKEFQKVEILMLNN
jgi:30S ribosomal protein 3